MNKNIFSEHTLFRRYFTLLFYQILKSILHKRSAGDSCEDDKRGMSE